MEYTVSLVGGRPWGIRLTGGSDFGQFVCIGKVSGHGRPDAVNAEAIKALKVGDVVKSINGVSTVGLTENEAVHLLRSATDRLVLRLVSRSDGQQLKPAANHHHQQHHRHYEGNGFTHFYQEDNNQLLSDDGELSASTSDSQGSVVQIIDNQKQRLCRSPSPGSAMSSTGTWPSAGRQGHKKQVSFNLPTSDATDESSMKQSNPGMRSPSTALRASSALKSSTPTVSTSSSGPPMSYLSPPTPSYHLRTRDKVLTPFQPTGGQRDQSPLRVAAANYRHPQHQHSSQPSSDALTDRALEGGTSTGNTSVTSSSDAAYGSRPQHDRSASLPVTSGQSNVVTSQAIDGISSGSAEPSWNLEAGKRTAMIWSHDSSVINQASNQQPQGPSVPQRQQQQSTPLATKFNNRFASPGPARPDMGRAYGLNATPSNTTENKHAKFSVTNSASQPLNSKPVTSFTTGYPQRPDLAQQNPTENAPSSSVRQLSECVANIPASAMTPSTNSGDGIGYNNKEQQMQSSTATTVDRFSTSWNRPSWGNTEAHQATWSNPNYGSGQNQSNVLTNATDSPSVLTPTAPGTATGGGAVSAAANQSQNSKSSASTTNNDSNFASVIQAGNVSSNSLPRHVSSMTSSDEMTSVNAPVYKSYGQFGLPPTANNTANSIGPQSRGVAAGWSSSSTTSGAGICSPPAVATVVNAGYRMPVTRASSVENAASSGQVHAVFGRYNHRQQGSADATVTPGGHRPTLNTSSGIGAAPMSASVQASNSFSTNRSNSLTENRGPMWMTSSRPNQQNTTAMLPFDPTGQSGQTASTSTTGSGFQQSQTMSPRPQMTTIGSGYSSPDSMQHAPVVSAVGKPVNRQTAVWSPPGSQIINATCLGSSAHDQPFVPNTNLDQTASLTPHHGTATTINAPDSSANSKYHFTGGTAESTSTNAAAAPRLSNPPSSKATPSSCFRLDMRPSSASAATAATTPPTFHANRPFSQQQAVTVAPVSTASGTADNGYRSIPSSRPFSPAAAAESGASFSSANNGNGTSDFAISNSRPISPNLAVLSMSNNESFDVNAGLQFVDRSLPIAGYRDTPNAGISRPFSPTSGTTVRQNVYDNHPMSPSVLPSSTANIYDSRQHQYQQRQQPQQSFAADVNVHRKVPPPVPAKPTSVTSTGSAVGRPFSPSSTPVLYHNKALPQKGPPEGHTPAIATQPNPPGAPLKINQRPFSPTKRCPIVEFGTSFPSTSRTVSVQNHPAVIATQNRPPSPPTTGSAQVSSPPGSDRRQGQQPPTPSSSPWSNSSRPYVADPVLSKSGGFNRASSHPVETRPFSPVSTYTFPSGPSTSDSDGFLRSVQATTAQPLATPGADTRSQQPSSVGAHTSKQPVVGIPLNSGQSFNVDNHKPLSIIDYHPQPFFEIQTDATRNNTETLSSSKPSTSATVTTQFPTQTGNSSIVHGGNRPLSPLSAVNPLPVRPDVSSGVDNSVAGEHRPFCPSLITFDPPRCSNSTARTTGYESDSARQFSPAPRPFHSTPSQQPGVASSVETRTPHFPSNRPFSPFGSANTVSVSLANADVRPGAAPSLWQPHSTTTDNRPDNVSRPSFGVNPPPVCAQQQQPLSSSTTSSNGFSVRGVEEGSQRLATALPPRMMRLFSPPPSSTITKDLTTSAARAESCPPDELSTSRNVTSGTGCYRPVKFCPQNRSGAVTASSLSGAAVTCPTNREPVVQLQQSAQLPNVESDARGGKSVDVSSAATTSVEILRSKESTATTTSSEIGNITSKLSLMSAKLVFGAERGRRSTDATTTATPSDKRQPAIDNEVSTTTFCGEIPAPVTVGEGHRVGSRSERDSSLEQPRTGNNMTSPAVLWKPSALNYVESSASDRNTDGAPSNHVTTDSTATVVRLFGDGKTLDSIGQAAVHTSVPITSIHSTNTTFNHRMKFDGIATPQKSIWSPQKISTKPWPITTSDFDENPPTIRDHRSSEDTKNWNEQTLDDSCTTFSSSSLPSTNNDVGMISGTMAQLRQVEPGSATGELVDTSLAQPTVASSMVWSPTHIDDNEARRTPWSKDAVATGNDGKASKIVVKNATPEMTKTAELPSEKVTGTGTTTSGNVVGVTSTRQITDRGTSPITIIDVRPSSIQDRSNKVTGNDFTKSRTDIGSSPFGQPSVAQKQLVLQTPSSQSAVVNGFGKTTTSSASQPQRCKSVTDWSGNGYHDNDDHAYSDVEISKSWRDGYESDVSRTRAGERAGSNAEKKEDSRFGKLGIIYQGIGPKDEDTGIPTALRNSVSDRHKKEWYKQMYNAIHKPTTDSDESSEKTLNGSSKYDRTEISLNGSGRTHRSGKIEDYEPLNQEYGHDTNFKKTSQNKSMKVESDTEVDYRSRERNGRQSAPPLQTDDCPAYDFRSWTLQRHDGRKQQQNFDKIHSNRSDNQDRKVSSQSTRVGQNMGTLEQWRHQANVQQSRDDFSNFDNNNKQRHRRPDDVRLNSSSSTPSSGWPESNEQHWLRPIDSSRDEDSRDGASSISSRDSDARSLQRPEFADSRLTRTYYGKARAVYTFHAQNPRELSFRKGDLIHLVHRIDKNWYEARLHGVGGIVPVNYLEVMTSLEDARNAASTREGQGKAKYNFTGQTQLELSFRKGDTLRLIRRVDSNWYEGRVVSSIGGAVGRRGIFPVSYVQTVVEPQSAPTTPVSSHAPSPLPDDRTLTSGQLSPVSSMSGPTRPSAPMSPVSFEDYSSDWDFDFERRTDSTLQRGNGRANRSTNNNDAGSNPSAPHSYQIGGTTSGRSSISSTTSADDGSRRRRDVKDVGDDVPADGLFSFDEARRVLDELNKRLRNCGVGTQPTSMTKSVREVVGTDPRRGRISSADGSRTTTRVATIGTTSGSNPTGNCSMTSDRRSAGVGGGSKRHGAVVKQLSNYPPFRVLYDYKPRNDDELELTEGDVIEVMECCEDGWFVGLSRSTNEFGTFPGNYVQKVCRQLHESTTFVEKSGSEANELPPGERFLDESIGN